MKFFATGNDNYTRYNNMKKIILILALIALCGTLTASMSKIYVGNEDGQFILGIEAYADNNATTNVGSGGLEIRTAFKKHGIFINGMEYGAIPTKTSYTLTLAGASEEGAILRFRNTWSYSRVDNGYSEKTVLSKKHNLETGFGRGGYLIYH